MTMAGTPLFAAPEVLRQAQYGASVDVWSYGCILATLHHRKGRLYPNEPNLQIAV